MNTLQNYVRLYTILIASRIAVARLRGHGDAGHLAPFGDLAHVRRTPTPDPMKNVLTFDIHGTEVLYYKGISRGKPAITIVVWVAWGAVHGSFTLPFDTPEARDADFARIDEARARNLVNALQLA